jgi:hypothetical protein
MPDEDGNSDYVETFVATAWLIAIFVFLFKVMGFYFKLPFQIVGGGIVARVKAVILQL